MGVKSIAIIGGGISGLSTLHYFKKQMGEQASVTLYERNAHVGGNIQTIREDGFCFETGPNGFLANSPATVELIDELGLSDQLIEANPKAKRRYVQINGRLELFPADPVNLIKTPLLDLGEKVSLISGLWKKNISKEQSIYDYVAKRFSSGVAANLVDPFISGIYAGDVKRLHMSYAFPKMGKKKGKGKTRMCSLKNGMGQLIAQLANCHAADIKTGAVINSLEDLKEDWIICTIPAYAASVLFGQERPALAQALESIVYAPVAVIGLAFPYSAFQELPDGFGYLIPSSQGKEILGVLIESNVYEGRAPQGSIMVRVMMGGRHHPQIINDDPQTLLSKAMDELNKTFGLKQSPVRHWVKMWPKAIPQYEMSYPKLLEKIQSQLTLMPRVTLAGNYLNGISFNDCILASLANVTYVTDIK